jgi:hypothetical protein
MSPARHWLHAALRFHPNVRRLSETRFHSVKAAPHIMLL